jgi:hypothetical protein
MEKFPWWTEAQINLAEDAKKFTDEVLIPIGERDALKKTFSWERVISISSMGKNASRQLPMRLSSVLPVHPMSI